MASLSPEVIRGWIPCGPGIGFGGIPFPIRSLYFTFKSLWNMGPYFTSDAM